VSDCCGFVDVGAFCDERTGLSFTIAAGPRQRSHSRVRVPWASRPYFTVSDWRLLFSSPPTTRRNTVEVFDPASTRDKTRRPLLNYLYSLEADPEKIRPLPSNRRPLLLIAYLLPTCLPSRCLTADGS
jgi:hypothetical protein